MLDGKFAKQLQDCTLSELHRYADQIEEAWWSEIADKSVRELLLEQGTTIIFDEQNTGGLGSSEEHLTFAVEVEPIDGQSDQNTNDKVGPSSDDTQVAEEVNHIEHDQAFDEEQEARDTDKNGRMPSEIVHEEGESLESDQPAITPVVEHEPDFRLMGKRRPQNHPTWAAVDILISENAFRDTQAHALSSLDREVAGVLVGPQPEKQPDGRYVVYISDSIIAKHTRMEGASVTYTPESWRYVNDRLDELFVDNSAVIVGWYHTHPGFGIFLSGMDRFIHRHFFTQIWHVAFVLDPLSSKSGFFCWNRNKTDVNTYPFPWPDWAISSW